MAISREKRGTVYEIQVQGELDPDWEAWFGGLVISVITAGRQPPTTTLVGPVADQAALRGILGKLWDLNLTLISLHRRMSDEDGKEERERD